MKKNILTIIVAFVAVVFWFTGCKPEYTTYSGPNFIMFSDTLYEMAVVDNDTYFDVPVVATRACDYDRNIAVEVVDAGSNAVEGKHYSIESNTVTIKAGELRANVRVKGYHKNLEVSDSLGFELKLIVPEEAQWDLYGTKANVLVKKACKLDINAFVGPCVVSSTFIMNYMQVDKILTRSELCPDEENTIIIKDYFFKGYDAKIKFEDGDVYNPLIRMDDQRFAPTADAFGTKYGDGYIHMYQPTAYTSYYSACEKFIFQYMTLYVPGMSELENTVGTFVNAVEWISEDEAKKLKREGY
ncbi:MAG: DUF4984 domain-containing protein [Bacteroidaceae bacterium]|nr:DUF4984 domain-containing protein [Bacteroidaceae bacterium]